LLIASASFIVEGNFAKLPPDREKNSIKLKFRTELRDSIRNEQKKSPSITHWELPILATNLIHYNGSDRELKKSDFQGRLYEKPYIPFERSQKIIQRTFKLNIPISHQK